MSSGSLSYPGGVDMYRQHFHTEPNTWLSFMMIALLGYCDNHDVGMSIETMALNIRKAWPLARSLTGSGQTQVIKKALRFVIQAPYFMFVPDIDCDIPYSFEPRFRFLYSLPTQSVDNTHLVRQYFFNHVRAVYALDREKGCIKTFDNMLRALGNDQKAPSAAASFSNPLMTSIPSTQSLCSPATTRSETPLFSATMEPSLHRADPAAPPKSPNKLETRALTIANRDMSGSTSGDLTRHPPNFHDGLHTCSHGIKYSTNATNLNGFHDDSGIGYSPPVETPHGYHVAPLSAPSPWRVTELLCETHSNTHRDTFAETSAFLPTCRTSPIANASSFEVPLFLSTPRLAFDSEAHLNRPNYISQIPDNTGNSLPGPSSEVLLDPPSPSPTTVQKETASPTLIALQGLSKVPDYRNIAFKSSQIASVEDYQADIFPLQSNRQSPVKKPRKHTSSSLSQIKINRGSPDLLIENFDKNSAEEDKPVSSMIAQLYCTSDDDEQGNLRAIVYILASCPSGRLSRRRLWGYFNRCRPAVMKTNFRFLLDTNSFFVQYKCRSDNEDAIIWYDPSQDLCPDSELAILYQENNKIVKDLLEAKLSGRVLTVHGHQISVV